MTLRKKTNDITIKYFTQIEQTSKRNSKPNTIPGKQNKKVSQNKKNFLKDIITGEGFRIVEGVTNSNFF